MLGQTLGNYRITDKIGKGGMADVYVAEHVLIGGQVAIKVLRVVNPRAVKRLHNEARIMASLDHPGLVKTFDFGVCDDAHPYLVMEHLPGETLKHRLRSIGRLPVQTALSWTRQLANALRPAHEAGVIHRDLKPANVFLVPDGEVVWGERLRILDFGIAKAGQLLPGSDLTRMGAIVGTPRYMAPEQCQGAGQVDHRADLYSLGCILFEMLIGRVPYNVADPVTAMSHHVNADIPDPCALDASLPRCAGDLVIRLLQKNPADRFSDAGALSAELDAIMEALELSERRVQPIGLPRNHDRRDRREPALLVPAVPTDPVRPTRDTTISRAVVSYGTSARRRSSRPYARPYAMIAGVVAVLALGGALLWRHVSAAQASPHADRALERPPTPVTEATPEAGQAPAPVPALTVETLEPAVEAPERSVEPIRISISTTPPGVEVFQMPHGVRVGVTPLQLDREPIIGEVVLVLQKPGYRSETLAIDANRSGSYTAELSRVKAVQHDRNAVRPDPRPRKPAPAAPVARSKPRAKPAEDAPRTLNPFDASKRDAPRLLNPFDSE